MFVFGYGQILLTWGIVAFGVLVRGPLGWAVVLIISRPTRSRR